MTRKGVVNFYIKKAKGARSAGRIDLCWQHLQFAHIAAQPMAWQHLKVHLLMLSLAIQTSNKREFVGQIARSLLAVPGTLSGRYPTGNPGSSDVSMFEVCDIPAEICEQFEGEKI